MIPSLPFGRTGHISTRTIFGAAAFWDTPQKEVDATMDLLLQNGVNHVDTAASYGRSQELLGNWIRRNGRPFFLATKTEQRKKRAAYDEIRRSLDLLHVPQHANRQSCHCARRVMNSSSESQNASPICI